MPVLLTVSKTNVKGRVYYWIAVRFSRIITIGFIVVNTRQKTMLIGLEIWTDYLLILSIFRDHPGPSSE